MGFAISATLLFSTSAAALPDAAALRKLPHVHSVEVTVTAEKPRARIVHLLNWHFVDRDAYAVDLRSVSAEPLTEEEIDREYEEFLASVETVQQEQMAVLRSLVRDHGLRVVYLEGLTAKDAPEFGTLVDALRRFESHKPKGETPIEALLLHEYRLDLLRIGAAGRLLLSRELDEVRPVEDAALLRAANPIRANSRLEFDQAANDRREDAIVRQLLECGGGVVILGGGHDLAANIEAASGGSCEYVRVQVRSHRAATQETSIEVP